MKPVTIGSKYFLSDPAVKTGEWIIIFAAQFQQGMIGKIVEIDRIKRVVKLRQEINLGGSKPGAPAPDIHEGLRPLLIDGITDYAINRPERLLGKMPGGDAQPLGHLPIDRPGPK